MIFLQDTPGYISGEGPASDKEVNTFNKVLGGGLILLMVGFAISYRLFASEAENRHKSIPIYQDINHDGITDKITQRQDGLKVVSDTLYGKICNGDTLYFTRGQLEALTQ